MYRRSAEVLFLSPQTKDYEMMSGARLLHLHCERSMALESKEPQEVIFGKAELSHRRCLWWMNLLHQLWPLHARFPSLWPALGFVDLHHKEGQDHHGTEKGKDRNGLSHVLVVPAWHYTSRNVPCSTFSRGQWSHLGSVLSKTGQCHFIKVN